MQYEKIALEQNTDEWLEFRRSVIGASDANIIMGQSKYSTRSKLLEEKRNPSETKQETSFAAERGHKVEDKKRAVIGFEFNLDLQTAILKHNDLPISASLDGWDQDKNIPWEHKLLGKDHFEAAKKGIFPEIYKPQVQQQLLITGADLLLFTVSNWHNEDEHVTLHVYPDVKYQNETLLPELKRFYDDWQNGTSDALNKKLGLLLSEYKRLSETVKERTSQIDTIKENLKAVKNKIFNLTPEKKYDLNGFKITISEGKPKTVIDFEKACVDNNVNLEQYTTIKAGAVTKRITMPKETKETN